MRAFRRAAFVTLSLCLVPALLPAQSLGEAAAKEKEKKKTKSAKVYTDDDLRRAGAGTAIPGATETGTAPTADGATKTDSTKDPKDPKEKTDDEQKAERQAAWHKKLEKAQADVAQYQKAVDDIQAALGASQSYYTPSRGKAVSDLDEAKSKLAQATQAAADLQEEGRRSGFR
jgi:hypothetical protein